MAQGKEPKSSMGISKMVHDLPPFFLQLTWLVAVKHPDVKVEICHGNKKGWLVFDARGEELQSCFF